MEFSGSVSRRPVSRRGESNRNITSASTQFAGMTSNESPSPLGMLRPGTSYRYIYCYRCVYLYSLQEFNKFERIVIFGWVS